MHAFASGDGPVSVDRVAPYPGDYTARPLLSPPSFTPSCAGVPCGLAFPGLPVRGTMGLITFPIRNMRATRDLSVRRCGIPVSVDPTSKESTIRFPQLRASGLELQLWPVSHNDAYESSPMLSLFALTVAPHCLLLADSASPRGLAYRFRRLRSRKLHTRELPPTHVPVGSAG